MADDEGKKMSVYGKTILNPQEEMGLLKNIYWRTNDISVKHIANVGDGTGIFTGVKKWSRNEIDQLIAERKYNGYGKRTKSSVVDVVPPFERFIDCKTDYDAKMHRDDRKSVYMIGRSVHDEEAGRLVPSLSSSNYGRRLNQPLESFDRSHARRERVRKGFYYKRGTGLPPIDDLLTKCNPNFYE
ncbi:cilia- and flagella-associated protein 90-like [Ruditapes philippinarum]|uniref:cilia- and flagella-associated protein 90-like n=1 Tax=Ruditapes philippinarum TaxID=129788 RepID=UPI00295A5E48|nr:cilia- and flagella-associated protein 90-like [Ruditapes philippinarum]